MYQLVNAVGKLKAAGARWSVVDIGDETMSDIYNRYTGVKAVLINSFFTTPKTLDLEDIKGAQSSSLLTFNEFLQSLGNEALPTVDGVPDIEMKYAIYSDGFRANYKATAANSNGSTNPNIPMSEKTWLALTKEGIDYQLFYKSCLVSINGLFHLTDTNGQAAFVVDGMKTCRHSGRNEIGLYSFREVGALEFVPITASMVHRRHEDLPLGKRLYIDIGTARPNKTALLVLGGYLHILDQNTFKQVADTIYCVDFQNYPLRERYYESHEVIDLSALALETRDENPDQIVVEELYSDENLTKYATLSQSFLVFVDNVDLFAERSALRRATIPNSYVSFEEPKYPLITGAGKVSDYWRVYEDKQWSVKVTHGTRPNHSFITTPDAIAPTVDNSVTPYDDEDLGHVHFLKVGTNLRIITGE